MQVLEIKLGKVPEWLHQRFKSKWKKPKETAEEKEERHQKQLEEQLLKKAEASNKAREEFIVTVGNLPESNAHIQDKRNWDLELFNKMLPLLSSPRAKKKARQYVSTRRAQSTARQHKQHMVKHLTTLKEEGGLLEGGTHKDTYDAKLKQKVKKKEDKKEKKAKEKQVKEEKEEALNNEDGCHQAEEKKEAEAKAADSKAGEQEGQFAASSCSASASSKPG